MRRVLVLAMAVGLVMSVAVSANATDSHQGGPLTPDDGKEIWRGSVLNGPNGLYVHPNGNVYAASVFGNEITVQNPRNGKILDRIGPERGVNGPDDVFIADDGTVYWTDILGGTVGMLKPDGTFKTQQVVPGVNPITMSDDGRLFVGVIFLGVGLYELDPDLEDPPVPVFADPTPIFGINGMDFGPDGLLYFPLFFTNQIARADVLNRTPGVDPTVEVLADGFRVPSAVKFNSKGELHVSDLAAGQVLKVELPSGDRDVVAEIEGIIDNLAFNARDQLFFAADSDAQIFKVTPSGRARGINRAGFSGPSTIAITDDGTVWVADAEARGFKGHRRNPTSTIYHRFDQQFEGPAATNTIAADGDLLITTGLVSGSVQVLNPNTGEIVEDIRSIGGAVNAIAHGSDLAIAQLGVGVVNSAGEVIADGFAYALGLASDGDTLYVTDWALGTVTAVTDAGSTVVASGLANPEGIAVDGRHLLVVEEGKDQVSAIHLGSGRVTTLIEGLDLGPAVAVSDFSPPHGALSGVAVGSKRIYVSQDGDNNAVFKFKKRGRWHRR